ncbi:MAG: efflux RND transporter permease subunit [Myxococcota bacterium]|nr:efflux RND transporter permease subunit [Myxococcota bacterium]
MRGLITLFVDNPVAANLLMAVLVVGGLATLLTVRQEEFPSVDLDVVQISVPYLGATPEEVEEAVCVRIEEAIEGTPGIDRMSSLAVEGACLVTVELATGVDTDRAASDLESRVNAITSFPAETEKPITSLLVMQHDVFQIAVSGPADERTLKVLGQKLRDGISALPGVSQVRLEYVRPYEISIEVSEQALRRHGITFAQVASAVRDSSLDLPGGSLKTRGGEILLRSKGQAYAAAEFESIGVISHPDGTTVTLGEIATVVDGFRDQDVRAFFDGQPAVMVKVFRTGDEDVLELAEVVKAYVETLRPTLPDGIELTIWSNEAESLRDRVGTLWRNALFGLSFVLFVLTLILRFRVAFWVAAGIPIALLGAVLLFPTFDYAISTLSVMGFLLVLGIVVDDAIVVGERIYARRQAGAEPREAAIEGAHDVAIPVVFGVLTTVAAFSPLVLVPGRMGTFFAVLGGTVILCLLLSLVEAQLILPAHLMRALSGPERARSGAWPRLQDRMSGGLEAFVGRYYQPALERVLEWRYLSVAAALGVLILTGALFASGRVVFQFFPGVEGDRIYATVTLPQGTPLAHTEATVRQLEQAAQRLGHALDAGHEPGPGTVRHILSSIGQQVTRSGPPMSTEARGGTHLAQVVLELSPGDERELRTREISRLWREETGPIPDAVEVKFDSVSVHAGNAIGLELASDDLGELITAAAELRAALATYDGVLDISDSFRAGKQEVQLQLLPEAEPLGLRQQDLARQVRTAFYGTEVQRVQRGQDDLRVMLRYPEEERRSLGDLENMRIRAPDGTEIPFAAVASAELGRGFATIRRTDGRRIVTVRADVDRTVVAPEEVMDGIRQGALLEILARHPSVSVSMEGEQKERSKALGGLAVGFLGALCIIYVLLAVPLRSYAQPLVIMAAIPFGTMGAILGHFIMGWNLVFFSLLGIVALSGVVVNDCLVLVDFINRERRGGLPLAQAVRQAGMTRFRAIFLTSATTFVGLSPLMFNPSQANFFVVPIAISLAFGVVVATGITLFVVPCGYMIVEDLGRLPRRLRGQPTPSLSVPEQTPG